MLDLQFLVRYPFIGMSIVIEYFLLKFLIKRQIQGVRKLQKVEASLDFF